MTSTESLTLAEKRQRVRAAAEADLVTFIRLVAPHRVLGHIHEAVCSWWTRQDRKSHQLTLLPRDHGKSALMAYRCAWMIAKRPDVRILYISSTSTLAEKQLKAIKDILTSDIFKFYWPGYVNDDEGKREKWTSTEISIDHPKRAAEGIRDSTVFTGGLTTSLTGLHCDIAVFDDAVVMENAYTEEGRTKVESQYSLLASVEGTDAEEWVVGTRYHPKDLYGVLQSMTEDVFDENGEVSGRREVYEVFERKVEDVGDGTGVFLWPRQQRADGKWFGFNKEILARKRAQYINKSQFRAQYYNDPNDLTETPIARSKFQYYEPKFLVRQAGVWYFKDRRLNVFAAIDFAFATTKRADYTSIVVCGMDFERNVYVLGIERFKTNKISEYYAALLTLYTKWQFRKVRAEVSAGQEVIVRELKDNYIKPAGLSLSIDEFKPSRAQGSKEERIATILEPRYSNLSIWHFAGGNCELLEEELVYTNPPHDDIKDSLAACVDICVPPANKGGKSRDTKVLAFNTRFGGVAH